MHFFRISVLSKRVTRIAVGLFMVMMLLPSGSAAVWQPGPEWNEPDVIPGRILVTYVPSESVRIKAGQATRRISGFLLSHVEEGVRKRFAARFPGRSFRSILPDTFVGTFNPAIRDLILKALAADPSVRSFEPDRRLTVQPEWGTATPNDPDRPSLWGMDRIGAPAAWAREPAVRSTVRAAVFEDRYDNTHPDLSAQESSVQDNTGPIDPHPTHVAGIIAATGNNGIDVVGAANVELVSIGYPLSNNEFINKISWAVQNQVSVVNMSWKLCGTSCNACDYPPPSPAVQNAFNNASASVVFVAAAGNDSCSTDSNGRVPLPAGYNNVLGISALNTSDHRASFSNYGSYVDLAAPGVSILSTVPFNANTYPGWTQCPAGTGTCRASGTSMASPHVAGSAAAVLAVSPTFDVASIPRLLELTAEDLGTVGRDNDFGYGVVRVDRAVAALADVYAESGTPCGTGTLAAPYCTVADAAANVPPGGIIGLVSGSFPGPVTLSTPATLISVGGTAVLGQ